MYFVDKLMNVDDWAALDNVPGEDASPAEVTHQPDLEHSLCWQGEGQGGEVSQGIFKN